MAMDDGDRSVESEDSADARTPSAATPPPTSRRAHRGRRCGRRDGSWRWRGRSLAGAMGVAHAVERFEGAVDRFDGGGDSELAFATMEAEGSRPARAPARSVRRPVQDRRPGPDLHAAHADAGRGDRTAAGRAAGQAAGGTRRRPLASGVALAAPLASCGRARTPSSRRRTRTSRRSPPRCLAAGAPDRSMAEGEIEHADEPAAALAVRIETGRHDGTRTPRRAHDRRRRCRR